MLAAVKPDQTSAGPAGTIEARFDGERGERLDRALAAWPLNLHFISNIHVEFLAPDAASSRCYFFAPMGRKREDGSQEVITNAGFYFDDLVKGEDGWRISKRVCDQTIMIGSLPPGYIIPE